MFWDTDQFSWLHQIVFLKILECFDRKHVPVQQVCFDASSTNVGYFVRDWWLKYQVDVLLQGSTATLKELLTQLHKGG